MAARTSVLIDSYRIVATCDSVYRCLPLSVSVVPNQRLLSEQRVSTHFDSTVCRSRRTDTLSNSIFSNRVAQKVIWRNLVEIFWCNVGFCSSENILTVLLKLKRILRIQFVSYDRISVCQVNIRHKNSTLNFPRVVKKQ